MKLQTVLIALLLRTIGANPHCRRYRSCVNGARDDYEQCVGGIGAAIIGDNENVETTNFLLGQTDRIVTCENRILHDITDYQLARQQEDEDILKCADIFTRHPSFNDISDIKKMACAGMPTSWDLRDLIADILKKPSQCRELYDLQLQRCSFLISCCPVYSLCTASVSLNSTVHSKVLSQRRKIADTVKQCLIPDPGAVDNEELQKHVATKTSENSAASSKSPKYNEKELQLFTINSKEAISENSDQPAVSPQQHPVVAADTVDQTTEVVTPAPETNDQTTAAARGKINSAPGPKRPGTFIPVKAVTVIESSHQDKTPEASLATLLASHSTAQTLVDAQSSVPETIPNAASTTAQIHSPVVMASLESESNKISPIFGNEVPDISSERHSETFETSKALPTTTIGSGEFSFTDVVLAQAVPVARESTSVPQKKEVPQSSPGITGVIKQKAAKSNEAQQVWESSASEDPISEPSKALQPEQPPGAQEIRSTSIPKITENKVFENSSTDGSKAASTTPTASIPDSVASASEPEKSRSSSVSELEPGVQETSATASAAEVSGTLRSSNNDSNLSPENDSNLSPEKVTQPSNSSASSTVSPSSQLLSLESQKSNLRVRELATVNLTFPETTAENPKTSATGTNELTAISIASDPSKPYPTVVAKTSNSSILPEFTASGTKSTEPPTVKQEFSSTEEQKSEAHTGGSLKPSENPEATTQSIPPEFPQFGIPSPDSGLAPLSTVGASSVSAKHDETGNPTISAASNPAKIVSPNIFAILFPKLSADSDNDTVSLYRNYETDAPAVLESHDASNSAIFHVGNVDLIHLNKEQGIAFCEKALTCEARLKKRELICQRRYAFPNLILDAEIELSDLIVQSELMINSALAGATEAVSKACLRPITTVILQQLSELRDEMESSRISCTRRTASIRNLIAFRNKAMCEAMMPHAVLDEKDDVQKGDFNNLKTRQNSFDYCTARMAPIREQCTMLRLCCPGYEKCSQLMSETNTSKKYAELMNGVKQIQSDCEKKIMATLKALHSGIVPLNT